MEPDTRIPSGGDTAAHVLELVEYLGQKGKRARHWYKFMWSMYLWLTGLGWVSSALVPFGLASLLFVQDSEHKRYLNIGLLLLSALSLCVLVLASVMRLRERAVLNLRVCNRLESLLQAYR